jgi:hypothetical protein
VRIGCVGKFKHFPQLFFANYAYPTQGLGMPGQLAGPVINGAFAPSFMLKQIVPDFTRVLSRPCSVPPEIPYALSDDAPDIEVVSFHDKAVGIFSVGRAQHSVTSHECQVLDQGLLVHHTDDDLTCSGVASLADDQQITTEDARSRVMAPDVTDSRPAIMRSRVDFPQPEAPTSETNWPSAMAKSIPCSTGIAP